MLTFATRNGMKVLKPSRILYIEPNPNLIYPRVVTEFLRLLGLEVEMVHCLPGAENFALGLEKPTAAIVNVDVVDRDHLDILVKHCKDTGVPLLAVTAQMTMGQVDGLARRGLNVLRV